MTMTTTPSWTITGLRAERADAKLDLASPEAGLLLPDSGDRLLGIDLAATPDQPLAPSDLWVRGDDLVAVYEPADPRQLRATALWRRLSAAQPAWDLVISAQTSLLESDSRLAVVSDLATGKIAWGRWEQGSIDWMPLAPGNSCPTEAQCLLIERSGDAVVLAVHPADARRIELTRGDRRLRIVCRLFPAEIEKGVLLRSRVRAAVGPRGNPGWASGIVGSLAIESPPLTT
jgi:hypothetical protein